MPFFVVVAVSVTSNNFSMNWQFSRTLCTSSSYRRSIYSTLVSFNFLLAIISTWQPWELLRRKWH